MPLALPPPASRHITSLFRQCAAPVMVNNWFAFRFVKVCAMLFPPARRVPGAYVVVPSAVRRVRRERKRRHPFLKTWCCSPVPGTIKVCLELAFKRVGHILLVSQRLYWRGKLPRILLRACPVVVASQCPTVIDWHQRQLARCL